MTTVQDEIDTIRNDIQRISMILEKLTAIIHQHITPTSPPAPPKLEWRDAPISDDSIRRVADSIFGNYEILRWSSGDFGGSIPEHMEFNDVSYTEFGNAVSIEQAQEIAEYNYNTRWEALTKRGVSIQR